MGTNNQMFDYTEYLEEEKKSFFKRMRWMAEEHKEICRSSQSIEEILEGLWEKNQQWHRENDARVYRESLTLEQLARL